MFFKLLFAARLIILSELVRFDTVYLMNKFSRDKKRILKP